jgi:hypothetical protein
MPAPPGVINNEERETMTNIEHELRPGDEHPLLDAIRKAIGVGTYDKVEVVLPQFERADGKSVTFRPDKNAAFFNQLRAAPVDVLLDIGMQWWDETLLLFPCEWYDCIPDGYIVTNIFGEEESFEHGKTDDDRRFGCLSYGFAKGKL